MFIINQNGIHGEEIQSITMDVEYRYEEHKEYIDCGLIRINKKIFAKFKNLKDNERVFNDILMKMKEGEKVYFMPKDENTDKEVESDE